MSTTAPSLCIPLTGSTMCPDFSANNAFIPPSVSSQITDITSFDLLIKASIETTGSSGFGSAMRSTAPGGYGCTGWDGTGLRYFQSTLCAYFVGMGTMNIAEGSTGTCNPPTTTVSLCASSAATFSRSWDSVLSNTTFCPNGADPNAIMYKAYIMASIQGILSSSPTCLVAEGSAGESAHCGFATTDELATFCSSNPRDACCLSSATSVPLGSTISSDVSKTTTTAEASSRPQSSTTNAQSTLTTAVPSTAASAASSSSNDTSSSKVPVAAIAAGVGGLLLVIALSVLFFCYRKRRNANAAMARTISPNSNRNQDTSSFTSSKKRADAAGIFRTATPANQRPPSAILNNNIDATNNINRDEIHEAICDWSASAADELTIERGDKIVLKLEYSDGWAFGANRRIGAEGFFPLAVLKEFANKSSSAHNRFSVYSKRAASITSAMEHNRSLIQQKYDSYISVQGGGGSSAQVKGREVNSTRTVTFKYTPMREDELELRVNDKVRVEFEYDDGWGYGQNLNTNMDGLFPLNVLDAFDDAASKRPSHRVSSLFSIHPRK
ncbi:hypothetical protein BDR26DRAFT_1013069 [Obelidium mucronatum]|nr:hypothetical protein BDR26DRAFT_1013069 [Obelidium mucronatum]